MKLLNFCIDGINLEIADRVFDLHNSFTLLGYAHDTWNRVFEINLQGDSHCENTQVMTNLNITVRDVSCVRIHNRSVDEKNVCFDGMQYVSEMEWQPDLVTQLEQEFSARNDSTMSIDWSTYLYIDFVWGVEILIAAETVEAGFDQTATLLA